MKRFWERLNRNRRESFRALAEQLSADQVAAARNIEAALYRKATDDAAAFILENIPLHTMATTARELIERTAGDAPNGLMLEFGVFQGKSLRWASEMLPERKFYGFDSFEGIQDAWKFRPAGTFRNPSPPELGHNVELVKGWFNDTIPPFLGRTNENVAWLHIDCDTYAATKTVLEGLAERLQKHAVILFGDFLAFPGWDKGGSYLAWREFHERHSLKFEYCGFARDSQQAAVVLR